MIFFFQLCARGALIDGRCRDKCCVRVCVRVEAGMWFKVVLTESTRKPNGGVAAHAGIRSDVGRRWCARAASSKRHLALCTVHGARNNLSGWPAWRRRFGLRQSVSLLDSLAVLLVGARLRLLRLDDRNRLDRLSLLRRQAGIIRLSQMKRRAWWVFALVSQSINDDAFSSTLARCPVLCLGATSHPGAAHCAHGCV